MVAKRRAQGSTTTRRAPRTNRRTQRAGSLLEVPTISTRGMNYKNFLRKIKASPLSIYLAGGVGAFFLGRFAIRYYRSHPEIQSFLKENFDTVEGKLREYKNSMMSEETEARH